MTTRIVYAGRGLLVAAFIVALAPGACGDGDISEPPGPPPVDPVASVDVAPGAPILVAIGDTVEFSATPRNAEGESLARGTVAWTSSDTAVAEVDSAGFALAVANGTSTISATIDGVTGSASLTVSQEGAALRIAIKPSGAAAGVAFDIQPVVQVVDGNDHVVTNDDTTAVNARIASGEGEIVGGAIVTVEAGVATFKDLGVRGRIGERRLRFEAEGLTAAVSGAFTVEAGPAEDLHIQVEPDGAEAGLPLDTQPVIEIHDANGNVAIDDSTVITASIASGGGAIVSGATATVQDGVATFADLAIDGTAGERTLRFEAEGLAAVVSQPFMIAAGSPGSLHIRVEPGDAEAGSPLGAQPVIEIRDGDGNVAAGDDSTVVTATIASGGGSIVTGGSATAQAGVATFADLTIEGEAGERTLRFEADDLAAAVSEPFMLAARPPGSLDIRVEPGGARAGLPLGTQPVIEIHDGNGELAEGDDSTVVTTRIVSGDGSITGGETATAQAGVATFTDLAIDGVVGEHRLRFEADGLAAAVSEPFPLTAGPAEALRIRIEPGDAKAGSALDTQPVIEIRDASGNIVTGDDSTTVTAAVASGGGSIARGGSATVEAGVATFAELAIDGEVGERTLRFEADGLTEAVSDAFMLMAGAPEALHIGVQPGNADVGSPLDRQPVIEIHDASGNVVADDDTTVVSATIASGGGSITGGGSATAQAGIAEFTGLSIDGDTGERTLRFEADDLAAAVSEPFTLSAGSPQSIHIRVQPSGAAAGVPLDTQPIVEIRDGSGNVVEDDNTTVVTATLASGDGSIVGGESVTVEAGVGTFTELAVGGAVGERTLRFGADGLGRAVSDAFALGAGPAASISRRDGGGQSAPADTELPVPLAVVVEDGFGNGVSGVAVEWTTVAGGGTLQPDGAPTDDDGVASAAYRLGRHPGVDTVEAAVSGLDGSPVTFAATATPNGRISGTVTPTNGQTSAGTLAVGNGSPGMSGSAAMTAPQSTSRQALRLSTSGTAPGGAPPTQALRPPSQAESVPDELIVTFRAQPLGAPQIGASAFRTPATAAAVVTSVRQALTSHEQAGGMTVVGVSPALLTARVRVDPLAIADAEQRLRADPAITRVERNAVAYASAARPPAKVLRVPLPAPPVGARAARSRPSSVESAPRAADPRLPNDEHFVWQAWHYHMLDLPRAWAVATGRPSVRVAVLDDGIRSHPDITPNLIGGGYDFVSDGTVPLCGGGSTSKAGDGDGYDPDPETPIKHEWNDPCAGRIKNNGGHGLHVAGIIGASSNNGSGIAGVNWNVSIVPVRVLDITGRGTHYDIAQGLLYAAGLPADDGAGGTVTAAAAAPIINMSLAGPDPSMVLEDAVVAATNAGSLIIAAAGNAGTAAPNYPAAYPQTVSVSAVQPDGSIASYSSFGSTIDIAAPGGETSLGCTFGVWSTTWNFVQNTSTFSCLAGTSMAAPHVAGVAALVLARQPGLTRNQLRARLIDFAVPAGNPNRYGAGIVNARNSVTQSHAPARTMYARLIDADDGATVATVGAAANGSYAFTELDDGDYYVYAGEDEDGDGALGVPMRRWGAAGGSAAPLPVTVDGADDYAASFEIGIPVAQEPAPDLGGNVLPISGYMMGESAAPVAHEFSIRVPSAGRYVFETSAVSGACGFALEANTRLRLSDETGGLIASNDDIDASSGNYCARITTTLQPGAYHLEVLDVSGRYVVSARKNP